jgi:hypothetical protein
MKSRRASEATVVGAGSKTGALAFVPAFPPATFVAMC